MTRVFSRLPAIAGTMVLALIALAALVLPSSADEASDRAALDRLFAELKTAPDAETAHAIDQRIWLYWTTPSDPLLAHRMGEVMAARRMMDLDGAIVLLDRIVVDFPTYAEAWNQRATFHYMLGNFDASLADIEKVLLYEPRHFGALSGRAMIHLQQGKRALAIKDISEALQYHPFLNERELFPELKQDITRI